MKYEKNWFQDYLALMSLCRTENSKPFFFCGAGVSIPASLPSWGEFVARVVAKVFQHKEASVDLARYLKSDNSSVWLIEAALAKLNTEPLEQRIRIPELYQQALYGSRNESELAPSDLHYLIVKLAHLLDVPIFTVNFDPLFEKAAAHLAIDLTNCIHTRTNYRMSVGKGFKFGLYYLHGRLGDLEVVAGEYDYLSAFNYESDIGKFFEHRLRERSCVFVGTSLKDQNINRFLLRTNKEANCAHTHYWFAALADGSRAERSLYEMLMGQLNVKPIFCDSSYIEVKAILRRIIHSVWKNPLSVVNQSTSNESLFKIWSSIQNMVELQRHTNAYDDLEFDLFFSDAEETTLERLVYRRVWSSSDPKEGRPRQPRAFSLDRHHLSFKSVDESMAVVAAADTLEVWTQIHSEQEDGRTSWTYIAVPVFDYSCLAASKIFVIKFTNKFNWLFENRGNVSKWNEFCADLQRLKGYLREAEEKMDSVPQREGSDNVKNSKHTGKSIEKSGSGKKARPRPRQKSGSRKR